jgi:hypothetical protein
VFLEVILTNMKLIFGEHVDIDVNYFLLKFEHQWTPYGQVIVEFHLQPFCIFKGHTGKSEANFW